MHTYIRSKRLSSSSPADYSRYSIVSQVNLKWQIRYASLCGLSIKHSSRTQGASNTCSLVACHSVDSRITGRISSFLPERLLSGPFHCASSTHPDRLLAYHEKISSVLEQYGQRMPRIAHAACTALSFDIWISMVID